MEHISQARGFDWDEANAIKKWDKHSVSQAECEQVFFNEPLVVAEDVKHSTVEQRYYVLGATDQGRRLFLVFTMRGDLIRVISAREMNQKERSIYQDAKE